MWRLHALLVTSGLLGCDGAGQPNPPSLWLDYGQTELQLVLVDHEPPPF